MARPTPIATLGDADPFSHGGGIVYKTDRGDHFLRYFEPGETEDDPTVIYQVAIDDNPMERFSRQQQDQIAATLGTTRAALNQLARRATGRAVLAEAVASTWGWRELDYSPRTEDERTVRDEYEADHDAAAKFEQRRRSQRTAAERVLAQRIRERRRTNSRGGRRPNPRVRQLKNRLTR